MRAGDTFRLAPQYGEIEKRHLWVVLSNPEINADRVVIVNITSPENDIHPACVVRVGDHPWISHDSVVAYEDAKFISVEQFNGFKIKGMLTLEAPASPRLLAHIRKCVWDSTSLPGVFADFLDNQGVLPPMVD